MTDSKIEFRGESEHIRVWANPLGDTYSVSTDVTRRIFCKLQALHGMNYTGGSLKIHKKFGPSLSKLIDEICENEKQARKAFEDAWRLSEKDDVGKRIYKAGISARTCGGGYLLLRIPYFSDTRRYLGRVKGHGGPKFMDGSWRIDLPAIEDLLPALDILVDAMETKNLDMSATGYFFDKKNWKLRVPLDVEVTLFFVKLHERLFVKKVEKSRVSQQCQSFDLQVECIYMAFLHSANLVRGVVFHADQHQKFDVLFDAHLDVPPEKIKEKEFTPASVFKLGRDKNKPYPHYAARLVEPPANAAVSSVPEPSVSSS